MKNRERFVTLANKRVNRTIKDLRLIGNLANRSNYSYTQADVKQIFDVLHVELKRAQERFSSSADQKPPEFLLKN